MNYFLIVFTEGIFELIGAIANGALGFSGQGAVNDSIAVFGLLDAVIQQLFSKPVWIKILSILFTGNGVFIAGMALFALIFYFFVMLKVTVMFVVSVVFISFLICLGPIFIPFMLFGITKRFFDSWWKQMLSFALQPVLLFTAFWIFHFLITNLFYSFLSFSVCQYCAVSIQWPDLMVALPGIAASVILSLLFIIKGMKKALASVKIVLGTLVGTTALSGFIDLLEIIPFTNSLLLSQNSCMIPFYLPVTALHGAGVSEGAVMNMFVLSTLILILVHAMWKFCDFSSTLTSRIVTGQFSPIATAVGSPEKLGGMVKSAAGLDDASYSRRNEDAAGAVDDAKDKIGKLEEERDALKEERDNLPKGSAERAELQERIDKIGDAGDKDSELGKAHQKLSEADDKSKSARAALQGLQGGGTSSDKDKSDKDKPQIASQQK